MKLLIWEKLGPSGRRHALARPPQRTDQRLRSTVRKIVSEVKRGGWDVLAGIAERIDGEAPVEMDVAPLAAEAREQVPKAQVEAMEYAAARIRAFQESSRPQDFSMETVPGLRVTKTWRPIDRVGLYVPGGKTPLFSSLMMLAIPATAAGVREIVTMTPPRPGGGLEPLIALAADLCGIERVWTLGGAQAIAAMAFGAGAVPKVDKICGPGNAYVAEAKSLVARLPGGPAIDMPAGPSELMVIADETANGRLAAADLLSQAEHDPAAQVLLVTPSRELAAAVAVEVQGQLANLPRRNIAEVALRQARILIAADLEEAVEIANLYAPEHLSLAVRDPQSLISKIRNAGAVFAGSLAAETFGDYLAGSSHVLPTDGAARALGGVSVYTFMKAMSVQEVTPEAALRIAKPAATLARMEQLEGHARAADARLEVAA